jgi:uncharacterized protein YndB with AHSA1/START domain
MTKPDVPLRLEFSVDVQGSPEQVWAAIASAEGISSWFLPTDLEEREGGTIVTHMGEDESSVGKVTGWDPPHRFVYEEDWASLTGHDGATVTPLVSEFLVEARSGGTCVVRVVTSAFGTGADWEGEFFADMEKMWVPFFDRLRLYLMHFPGQRATALEVSVDVPGAPGPVVSAIRQALGVEGVGSSITIRDLSGRVEQIGEVQLLIRLTSPIPGLLAFVAFSKGDGVSTASVQGHLFSEEAPAFVERERPVWKAWLENLVIRAT